MAEIVTMPKLGFDMAEGTLVRWVKAEGDAVEKGEVIAEIETDKATVEVESSFSGVMNRHLAEEGAILPVNSPIAIVAEEGESLSDEEIDALVGEAGGKPSKKKEKPEKKEEASKSEAKEEKPAEEAAEEEKSGVTPAGGVRSSPLARRIAEEHDIELTELEGSGPQGRIVKKDVQTYLEKLKEAGREEEAEVVGKVFKLMTTFSPGEIPEDEVIEMSRLRQAIGRRMQDSNQNYPHFYVTRSFNTGPMMALRKELNQLLPEEDKLSVNDFIVKAVAIALRQYPNLNASIENEKQIRSHGQVNVGVAVAVEGGLLTIVCLNADQKPIRLIAREIREMAGRARDGKVKNEDIQGSTFSISNLGMFGVDDFSAIINPPEAGILAVSAVQKVPVVEDDVVKVGSRMKATLSADHRVTDGAEAAEFMQVLATYIEEPMRLLL
jgi:pyruvate dehydrogenase E2 component (dihydrolipoamide acetyltransferase)